MTGERRAGDDVRAAVAQRLRSITDVVESGSMFRDGPGYWVNGKEIAHFEEPDVVEIRLTRAIIGELRPSLKRDPRIELRRSGADWLDVHVTTHDDVPFVVDLLERAAAAHRAAPGSTPKSAPTGAELDRRRRFH